MPKPVIGILTWREGRAFAEPAYFRKLIREGEKLGATLFLFSPRDVIDNGKQVNGYIPIPSGGWGKKRFPIPHVVIDRYRYTPTPAFKEYVTFRKKSRWLYANNRLANKWKVHQVLWANEQMRIWLPQTEEYSKATLNAMLNEHQVLYVKPSNGTGGKGILKIERKNGGFRLLGRDSQRAKTESNCKTESDLINKAHNWVSGKKFIVQQGLKLDLLPKRAVDIRLLIQKNEAGHWSVTGKGLRIGGEKSATSNLHGGGKAVQVNHFLQPIFGEEKTREILSQCDELAFETASTIEAHFGRMMELGLDIGVDVSGRVWLIEVNPKPGREIFRHLGNMSRYLQAIRRPIQYALYLHRAR